MKFFQHKSLQKELGILFASAIIIALGATLIFYITTIRSMQSKKYDHVKDIAANLTQHTEDFASTVRLMAETVSNTSYTHSFLTVQNAKNKTVYQQYLNRLISKLIVSSPYISNILLIDTAETVYSFSSFDHSLAGKLDQQYHIFSTDRYSEGFSGALYLSDTNTVYAVYTQPIYNDIYAANKRQIGTCLIICSFESLNHVYANVTSSEQSLFAILDSEDQILVCNRETDAAYRMLSGSNSDTHLIFQSDFPTLTEWNLICTVPYSELYSELIELSYLATLLIFVMLLAFLLLSYYINRSIVLPLVKIVSFFKRDSFYVLHNHLKVKGSNEINLLTTSINQMLCQINELSHTILQNQAQLYEIQLSKNQAQLLALQTQINPHFLYNTLNSIKGLTYQSKNEEIRTAVDSLSFIMRYNFDGNNMTCIKNEFLCIEKYLRIIELRFPKRFLFRLNMDDRISDYEMPRFLLQPLVENAISHGLEPSLQKGTLTLTASLQDNSMLHFECTDNGGGISPDKLEELRQKLENTSAIYGSKSDNRFGIGLMNIHMRIQLIYGTPYGLSIYSSPKGTTVCADFPVSVPEKDRP